MPIIPQYRADGPAQPIAPQLEAVQRTRVDASTALRGLAELSGAVGQVAQPLPNAPETLGQGAMRGLAEIGAGVRDVGQAMFDVEERIAEAWNFTKLSEAQEIMDREVANFESWKLTEPNPNKWTAEWNSRFERTKGQILNSPDLSPAAKDAINQRVITFGTRHGYGVQLEAQKTIISKAKEAVDAELMRAENAGDLDAIRSIADYAVSQGLRGEDWKEYTVLKAQDAIEGQQLDAIKNYVKADIDAGNYEVAKERIQSAPGLREDEKMAWLSGVDKQERQIGFVQEVDEIGYFDPDKAISMLQETDQNGNWSNWNGMSDEARFKKAREFEAIRADGWTRDAEIVNERIVSEGLTPEDLASDPAFNALPKQLQAVTVERIRKGALDAFMELSDFQAKVRNLDTRTHEGKIKASEMLAEAQLRFTGEAAQSAISTVKSAIENPKPLMPDAEAITMARSSIRERFENQEFGRFKYPKSEILEQEIWRDGKPTGEIGYFVVDPNPPDGFGFRGRYASVFGKVTMGDERLRQIMLSPDEVKKFKDEKTKPDEQFTDQVFYQAAGRKFIDSVEEVERRKSAGEFDSATSYGDELARIMGISKHEGFERREQAQPQAEGLPGSGGSPDGSLWPPVLRNPVEKLNQLKNATGY